MTRSSSLTLGSLLLLCCLALCAAHRTDSLAYDGPQLRARDPGPMLERPQVPTAEATVAYSKLHSPAKVAELERERQRLATERRKLEAQKAQHEREYQAQHDKHLKPIDEQIARLQEERRRRELALQSDKGRALGDVKQQLDNQEFYEQMHRGYSEARSPGMQSQVKVDQHGGYHKAPKAVQDEYNRANPWEQRWGRSH